MLAATKTALATVFVLASASAVLAESHNRATQRAPVVRSTAPPASFEQRNPTTKPAVKPFTAEEKGWFDRASRVY